MAAGDAFLLEGRQTAPIPNADVGLRFHLHGDVPEHEVHLESRLRPPVARRVEPVVAAVGGDFLMDEALEGFSVFGCAGRQSLAALQVPRQADAEQVVL